MSAYLVFYTFQYLVIPLVPPYTVQDLGLTDGEISLGNAIFYIVMMAVSLPMGRLSARFGNRRLLVFGGLTLGLYPFLNSLAHDATLYCIASAVGGASWAILSVGLANCLMERSAKGDRPAYMTIHNLALNLGMLMGSLTGPLLGDWVGLRTALLIGTGLRVLAGVFLWAATDDYLSV
jgi:MFS family permease